MCIAGIVKTSSWSVWPSGARIMVKLVHFGSLFYYRDITVMHIYLKYTENRQ